MSQIKTVRLYGEMARRWGKVHTFYANSAREVISAMVYQFEGFKKYLLDSGSKGLRFKVTQGKDSLVQPTDFTRNSQKELHIKPVLSGGKRAGLGQTILGAVLVAVGVFMTVKQIPGGQAVTAAGVSLMAGGIAQMLVKTPKKADSDSNGSYLFSGNVNTTQQGVPVPVGYGRLIIGSCVISASIDSVDTGSPAGANGIDVSLGT